METNSITYPPPSTTTKDFLLSLTLPSTQPFADNLGLTKLERARASESTLREAVQLGYLTMWETRHADNKYGVQMYSKHYYILPANAARIARLAKVSH